MALVPLLAIAGVFGERRERREVARGPLVVTAQVPTRFRYRQRMATEITVANRGTRALSDVRVRVDSGYLARFSNVTFSLAAQPDGSVSLATVIPGQSVRLVMTVEGERAGVFRGDAVVTDAAADSYRFQSVARALEGEPTVLIANGSLIEDAMNRERVSGRALMSELHRVGLTEVEEVQWAILETSGTITIVPRRGVPGYVPNSHSDEGAQGF